MRKSLLSQADERDATYEAEWDGLVDSEGFDPLDPDFKNIRKIKERYEKNEISLKEAVIELDAIALPSLSFHDISKVLNSNIKPYDVKRLIEKYEHEFFRR